MMVKRNGGNLRREPEAPTRRESAASQASIERFLTLLSAISLKEKAAEERIFALCSEVRAAIVAPHILSSTARVYLYRYRVAVTERFGEEHPAVPFLAGKLKFKKVPNTLRQVPAKPSVKRSLAKSRATYFQPRNEASISPSSELENRRVNKRKPDHVPVKQNAKDLSSHIPGWTPGFQDRFQIVVSTIGGPNAAAKSIGVSYNTIRQWRDGVSRPSLFQVKLLSELAGRNLNWLLGEGVEPEFPVEPIAFASAQQEEQEERELVSAQPLQRSQRKTARHMHPELKRILSQDIEILELSTRSEGALRQNNINKLSELVALSSEEILQLKGCGKNTIAELKSVLGEVGISLSQSAVGGGGLEISAPSVSITAEQIRGARVMLLISQGDLAAASGISRNSLSKIEGGLVVARKETIASIRRALEQAGAIFMNDSNGIYLGVCVRQSN